MLGIEAGGVKKAYPFSALRNIKTPLEDTVSGKTVKIYFDPASEEAYAEDRSGRRIPGVVSYWFVWYSFHPGTLIFRPLPAPE